MPKVVSYRCGICSKEEGEANHWWTVRPPDPGGGLFLIHPFSGDLASGEDCICGEECVHTAVSKYMGKLAERERAGGQS